MEKKYSVISSVVLMCIGLALCIVFVMVGHFKKPSDDIFRPDESFYCTSDDSFYSNHDIEVSTKKDIDVNNCYAIFDENGKTVKEKLNYRGFDEYYCFRTSGLYSSHSYKFVGIEVRDSKGNLIALTQISESEELAREAREEAYEDTKETFASFATIGAIIAIIGFAVLVSRLRKRDDISVELQPEEEQSSTDEPKMVRVCEYCGHENSVSSGKCECCGANLKTTKKN